MVEDPERERGFHLIFSLLLSIVLVELVIELFTHLLWQHLMKPLEANIIVFNDQNPQVFHQFLFLIGIWVHGLLTRFRTLGK